MCTKKKGHLPFYEIKGRKLVKFQLTSWKPRYERLGFFSLEFSL